MDTKTNSSDPITIAIVAPSLDILGGQAVQAKRLIEAFEGTPGVRAMLIPVNPRLPGPFAWLQRIKYVRTVVTEVRYLWDLGRQLRRFDVIHVFAASYFSFLLAPTPAILIAKLCGKSTLINYRSGQAEDHLRRWRRTAIPALRAADRIVVPSGYLVEVLSSFGLDARAVPNHVPLDRLPFRTRRPLRPHFLSNRNFEAHYNVACILRAFALIQQVHPDARLTVAGDGPEAPKLRDLAAELELRNVRFVGRVPPERMAQLYNEVDIYLNAPDIDNMPNSILEAFAAGLPVITTNAGGIPWIVRHEETGLMVDRGDAGGLATSAIRLLNDPELAADLAWHAHEECHRRYGWPAVRDQWLEIYRELTIPALEEARLADSSAPVAEARDV